MSNKVGDIDEEKPYGENDTFIETPLFPSSHRVSLSLFSLSLSLSLYEKVSWSVCLSSLY